MVLPILGAALGLGTALIGARSANRAADAQEDAASQQFELGQMQLDQAQNQFDRQFDQNQQIYDDQIQGFQPYSTAGRNALMAYNSELGIGNAPSNYRGYEQTAANRYQMEEGARALEGSAAASADLFSGATAEALQQQRMGIAAQGYDTFLNRLSAQAGMGQAAAGLQANAGQNLGAAQSSAGNALMAAQGNAYNFQGNALANSADATAAGAIGVGNALQNGINTGLGVWNYQNRANTGATTPTGFGGGLY